MISLGASHGDSHPCSATGNLFSKMSQGLKAKKTGLSELPVRHNLEGRWVSD